MYSLDMGHRVRFALDIGASRTIGLQMQRQDSQGRSPLYCPFNQANTLAATCSSVKPNFSLSTL